LAKRHDRLPKLTWSRARAADGSSELDLHFGSCDEARAFALSCGPLVEVLEPELLREQVARLASEMVALYARP
jgi:predicted DNA-binding transcriptional regulator YafY